MTFEEWQATRQGPVVFTQEQAGAYEGEQGFLYEGFFFLFINNDGQYEVPLPTEERAFGLIADAERYLWTAFADGEING